MDADGSWYETKPINLGSGLDSGGCLQRCMEEPGAITGCTYRSLDGGCGAHSGKVVGGSGVNGWKCWKLKS